MASKPVKLIVVVSLLFIIAGIVGWYLYQTQQAAQTASNQKVQTMISQLTDLSKQLDTSHHTITQEEGK